MKIKLFYIVLFLISILSNETFGKVRIDGIYYNLKSDNTAELVNKDNTCFNTYSGDITIPSKVDYNGVTYEVTSIGDYGFNNCRELTTVSIPSSVTSIGKCAFHDCYALPFIDIPNSVTSIGDYAFSDCGNITSITIPQSVVSIGKGILNECRELKTITVEIGNPIYDSRDNCNAIICTASNKLISGCAKTIIPNTVTIIGEEAFRLCRNLIYIDIPNSVTSIDEYAFFACYDLLSITIPNSVKYIGDYAFQNCSSLFYIKIPNSITSIGKSTFYNCSSLSSLTIPNSVTIIGDRAFADCSNLQTVYIGNGITTIDGYAFGGCTNLKDFYCYAKNLPTTKSTTFISCSLKNVKLYVPYESVNSYKKKEPWMNFKIILGLASSFKLTYIIDGDIYKTTDVEYGSNITAEPIPTKEGYTFSGWSEIPETMPASDVTITGSFTINKYKLTYTLDGEEYKTDEVDYGTALTPEDAPVKDGYTFSGWSEIPSTMPAEDVTVTGTFTANKYKLTYMVDGEEYKASEVDYGTAITAEAVPTKEGYTFSGWSEIPSTMPAEDVTVTGTFTVNKYTITYMVDDAVLMTEEVAYGSTIAPPKSQKDGYDILWSFYPTTMPAYSITINGTYTTGISSLSMEESDRQVFTPDGKRVETPKKGLNIIRMSDGTVKKVLVK